MKQVIKFIQNYSVEIIITGCIADEITKRYLGDDIGVIGWCLIAAVLAVDLPIAAKWIYNKINSFTHK